MASIKAKYGVIMDCFACNKLFSIGLEIITFAGVWDVFMNIEDVKQLF